jgi:signal transduction histidine kinase
MIPFKTLRFKISLSLIAFIFITCWVLSFIFVVNDLNRLSEDIQREGEFFAETLVTTIPALLLNKDYKGINIILENAKKRLAFNYILITDSGGDIVARIDGMTEKEDREIKKISKNILYDGMSIGNIEIGMEIKSLFPRMGNVLLEAFAFSLFFMFIGTFLSIILSRKITRPVEKLSERVMTFTGTGEQDKRFHDGDEVEIMERSFTNMINSLKKKETQIEEKNRELLNLAGGVSHELNNIINIIIGFSRVLQKEVFSESEHYRDVENIMREAKKAKVVVENLMDFAKPQEIEQNHFDVGGCLEGCIADLESQIKVQGINIRREYQERLPNVKGDERQLREAFFNIILNSIQAMPGGGELTLSCRRHNNNLEIKISDTGEGIPEEIKEEIFEPLFTTKKGARGIGLGLPISRKIIERHKGEISFTSKRGEGTAFYIRIPIE